MTKFLLILFSQLLCASIYALNFTIIESQSIQSGLDMDLEWKNVVSRLGHSATIAPQSTLDNDLFFLTTDILIISSGEIELPANRVNTILKFIMSGKPVYLQSEHLSSISTNQAFEFILSSLGGTFNWKNLYGGDLQNIKVTGTFKNTLNQVKSLKYYWYSVSGEGDCRTVNFLEYGGEYHGFQYIPFNPLFGSIITTTDQDWVRETISQKLMENIITHLISPPPIPPSTLSVNIGDDTSLCIGDTLILDATTPNASYLWQDSSTSSTLLVSKIGTYWVEVKNSCGTASDAIEINFISKPKVDLVSDTSMCEGTMLFLDATTPNGSYRWLDGSTNSIFSIVLPGTYWVEINNKCDIDTFTTIVRSDNCQCSLYIPNIFTPNSDNNNDNFLLLTNCPLFDYSLAIFDRWGNLAFESKDNDDSWKGNYNGKIAQSGVYVFHLSYSFIVNRPKSIYGSITLLNE